MPRVHRCVCSQVRMATQSLVLCSNKQPSWTEDFEIFLFKHAEFMCLLRHLRHYKNVLQRLVQTLPQSSRTFPKTRGPSESPCQLRSLAPVPPAPQAHISNSFTQNDRTLPPSLTPPSPFMATTTATLFLAALCVPLPFSSPCIVCSESLTAKDSSKSQITILRLWRFNHPTPV